MCKVCPSLLQLITTLNMVFSVAYYLELHSAIYLLLLMSFFYQVNLLMFYDVQTTNLTWAGKIWELHVVVGASRNSEVRETKYNI